MPSPQILSARALIERDTSTGPGATGPGRHVPSWSTVTAAEPCASPQPMTDRLKRTVAGDVAAAEYWSMTAITADVAKGDRVTVDGTRYRVEARRAWTSGPGRAHHIQLGLDPMPGGG